MSNNVLNDKMFLLSFDPKHYMMNIVVDEHLKLYTVAIVNHHIPTDPRLSHLWCCDRGNKSLHMGVA